MATSSAPSGCVGSGTLPTVAPIPGKKVVATHQTRSPPSRPVASEAMTTQIVEPHVVGSRRAFAQAIPKENTEARNLRSRPTTRMSHSRSDREGNSLAGYQAQASGSDRAAIMIGTMHQMRNCFCVLFFLTGSAAPVGADNPPPFATPAVLVDRAPEPNTFSALQQ